jgi:hypothetical protein
LDDLFDFFTDRTFQPEELLAKFRFLRDSEFLQTQRDLIPDVKMTSKTLSGR